MTTSSALAASSASSAVSTQSNQTAQSNQSNQMSNQMNHQNHQSNQSNQMSNSLKSTISSFNMLKYAFNPKNEFNIQPFKYAQTLDFDEDDLIITFSSTEFIAVLMYELKIRLYAFVQMVDNDEITHDLNELLDNHHLITYEEVLNNLNHETGFKNLYYPYVEFIKIVYNSIKKINSRRSNCFKNPIDLKIVFMAHEFFDGFKYLMLQHIQNVINPDLDKAIDYEESIDYNTMIEKAVREKETIEIKDNNTIKTF